MKEKELNQLLVDVLPKAMRKLYSEIRPEGMPKSHFRLLNVLLHHPGHPMKYYVEKVVMKKSNFTLLIDEFIEKGWVQRVRSEEDRRVVILELTDEGRQYLSGKWDEMRDQLTGRLSVLTNEEKDKLGEAVKVMSEVVEKIC